MSDPKDPEEDPIEAGGTPPAEAGPAAQPWGAGARRPRKRRTGLWAGFAVVVVVAVAALAWPVLRDYAPPGLTALLESAPARPDPALAALAGRIARLEAEIARLDTALARAGSQDGGAAMAETRTEIQAAVSRLASRLGVLEVKPTTAPRTGAAPDGRIEALAARLAGLEAAGEKPNVLAERLEKLERRIAADTGAAARDRGEAALARVLAENERLAAALERMTQKIAGLETRLGEAQKAAEARAGLGRDLAAVTTRLGALEAKAARLADADLTRKGDALLLAIGQLRDAIAGDRPFSGELAAVLRIAGQDEAIGRATAPIAPLAARGIPTRAQLTARFAGLAAKAAQAAIAPEEGGWLGRTAARLARVVTIRRVGQDVTGETTMAALARAEARLASGDLAGAASALDPVGGKPAEVLADWRAAALARSAAKAAITRLSAETIARLAKAANGAKPAGGAGR